MQEKVGHFDLGFSSWNSIARDVTDVVVGSGDWFGGSDMRTLWPGEKDEARLLRTVEGNLAGEEK